jgi:excisionase family DNA binding protein
MAALDADLLKPTEIAAYLGVSRSWVYLAARKGRIPYIRVGGPGGPLRFVRGDIERWLEQARQEWLPGESTAQAVARAAEQVVPAGPQLTLDGLTGDAGSDAQAAPGS